MDRSQKSKSSVPNLEQGFLFDTGASPIVRKRQNHIPFEKRERLLEAVKTARLNAQQQKAVEHLFGPLVIRAGAGSGKTGSIAYRVSNLVGYGATPGRILCVTFTREAAKEMKGRCKKLLVGDDLSNPITRGFPKVRTLHALGLKILFDHHRVLGFKHGIQVLPEMYKDQFLEDCLELIPADIKSQLPKGRSDDPYRPQVEYLSTEISALKNVGISPSEADKRNHFLAKAYLAYQSKLQREGYVDIDDLIRLPSVIFERDATKLLKEQQRYDFVIVDEFQDINPAQLKLIKLLSEKHNNLSVVGDDDQSIYGWRGGDVSLIINFPKDYPTAQQITFDINYRSTPEIVELANNLISCSNLTGRKQKVMISANQNGVTPLLHPFTQDTEEAIWIADGIKNEVISGSREFGDYAILVRDRFKAERIEEELAAKEIPYQTWFSDRFPLGPTRRNAYAILDALHNLDNNPAILQLIRSPQFEVEKSDREKVMIEWEKSDQSVFSFLKSSNTTQISPQSGLIISNLIKTLEELKSSIPEKKKKGWMAHTAKQAFIKLYPTITSDRMWNDPNCHNFDTRMLRRIWQRINQYEQNEKTKPNNRNFSSFLQFEDEIRRRAKEGKSKTKAGEKRSAVWIMSFHAAKGLEFPVVYMPYLVEGALPDRRAIENKDLKPEQLEEELRLAFVGVTRAEEELRLSYPLKRLGARKKESFQPSRYIQMMGVRYEGQLF